MANVEQPREVLERSWREAEASKEAAFNEVAALERQEKRIERDITDRSKWLKAFLGEDEALRNQLVDSAEFLTFDPIAAQRDVLSLYAQLRDKRAELKAAKDRLDKANKAEHRAFYQLEKHKQKVAVVGALQAELALGNYLRAERAARESVCQRELAEVGSLPVLTRTDLGSFDQTYSESGICHRFRSAIAAGYITGHEQWVKEAGVRWDR